MIEGIWAWLATPGAAILIALVVASLLIYRGYHRDAKTGILSRRKLASVFILSASTYTFAVIAVAELVFSGPTASEIVEFGFGNERVAWLLVGVTIDGVFRVWSDFSSGG